MSPLPGQLWWKVHCWMQRGPLQGEWESQWFHGDVMLIVSMNPTKYTALLMPLGLEAQNAVMN